MSKAGKLQRKQDQMCREIVQMMLDQINAGEDDPLNRKRVILEQDWGGNTATILYPGGYHDHVGAPGEDFDLFVSNLHGALSARSPE